MKPETREALEGSILKWQKIVDGTGADRGGINCPLCRRFDDSGHNDEGEPTECTTDDDELCPVAIRTGETDCGNTPYIDWAALPKDARWFTDGQMANTPERKAAAQRELDFLISLRPTDGEKA